MVTNNLKFETKFAMLSSEFGERMAREWFGDNMIDSLPKYIKGKYKGKPKGIYEWDRSIQGAYSGKIIRRRLKNFISTADGIFHGDVLCSLGYNEKIEDS